MGIQATERMINNIFCLFWAILIIGLIWEWMEVMFYGDVQPGKVDEIITLIWIWVVVKAYYIGWKHGMEA